jgi:hypothetical protein
LTEYGVHYYRHYHRNEGVWVRGAVNTDEVMTLAFSGPVLNGMILAFKIRVVMTWL